MQVVGIEKGHSKKYDSNYTRIHTVREFDDYAKKQNASGVATEIITVWKDIQINIQDTIQVVYGNNHGKAVIRDILIDQK